MQIFSFQTYVGIQDSVCNRLHYKKNKTNMWNRVTEII
jgi:hypothetical protein